MKQQWARICSRYDFQHIVVNVDFRGDPAKDGTSLPCNYPRRMSTPSPVVLQEPRDSHPALAYAKGYGQGSKKKKQQPFATLRLPTNAVSGGGSLIWGALRLRTMIYLE